MFHVELKQFPHNACAFNLDEDELFQKLVGPWSRDEWVELGERKWSPHRARLTVLEGPRLDMADLSMGRGWRSAQREGRDMTDALLARAHESPGAERHRTAPQGTAPQGTAPPAVATARPAPGASEAGAGAKLGTAGQDPEGHALRALLGDDPDALLAAWRLAAERRPELSPSESLALAEHALGALDGAGPA